MKRSRLSLVAAALALGACNVLPPAQSDPTRYFVLTGPAELSVSGVRNIPAAAKPFRIGLRTVQVANYLSGPEMVVRRGSNEIELAEYSRWGETLEAGITRVLREQLAAAPGVTEVVAQPFPYSVPLDYVVSVSVLHCEGSTGGPDGRSARFEAIIRISTGAAEPRLVVRKVFTAAPLPWDGRSYGELAAALSQDVAELGRQIIASLPQPDQA